MTLFSASKKLKQALENKESDTSSNVPTLKRRASRGPAFLPCVDVCAPSLLRALIALAQQVISCQRPKGCQRRNAGIIRRRIRLLCVLFEEVRDAGVPLPPSALLCFRELYVILQRTKFLLEDCSGDVSCLWLLVQTEAMSNRYHVLTDDMATALDVLPLRQLGASDEVREQVELIHRQARKTEVWTDAAEERLCRDVLAVLEEFEKEVTPDGSRLRRIFHNLQLTSARDCQREIELLEEELRYQNKLGAERNLAILSSLLGFVRYCKCVLFGVTNGDFDAQSRPSIETRALLMDTEDVLPVPEDFRCPISLDLMQEPVIVSTGQTYDRASIAKWIEEGHFTCPKSGQKLEHTNLIPNHALRNLISQYCDEHNIPLEKSEKSKKKHSLESIASTKAALEATKMTVAFLVEKLATGSGQVKKQVAYELRLLAKCGMDNRACIADAGAIPLLVPLLSSDDPKGQENAVTALLNLSIYESNKVKIMQSGALEMIINVLRTGCTMEARQNAAATLFSLSVVDEYKKLIGETPEAIPALVDLLRDGTARGKRDATTALFNLSVFHGNALRVVAAGAVPLLVNLLKEERPGLTDDALAVLRILARQVEGLFAIRTTCAVPLLVNLLQSGSSGKGKENSISVLLTLCCNGGDDIVNDLLRLPSLMPSLYSLLLSGTARAKRKASTLLRILQSWDP